MKTIWAVASKNMQTFFETKDMAEYFRMKNFGASTWPELYEIPLIQEENMDEGFHEYLSRPSYSPHLQQERP